MDKQDLVKFLNDSVSKNTEQLESDLYEKNAEIFKLLSDTGITLTQEQKDLINLLCLNTVKNSASVSSLVTLELIQEFSLFRR